MSGVPIINGLMVFFTLTTIAVIAYPIVKILPSWLEGAVHRKIAFHRDAIIALEVAIDRAGNDPAQHARLTTQLARNKAALTALAPADAPGAAPVRAQVDAAA